MAALLFTFLEKYPNRNNPNIPPLKIDASFHHASKALCTLIIAIFITGVIKLVWGFRIPVAQGRWWIVLSGVLSVLVAGALYSQFPFSAAWAFGVLIGINLIVEGYSLFLAASRWQSEIPAASIPDAQAKTGELSS